MTSSFRHSKDLGHHPLAQVGQVELQTASITVRIGNSKSFERLDGHVPIRQIGPCCRLTDTFQFRPLDHFKYFDSLDSEGRTVSEANRD